MTRRCLKGDLNVASALPTEVGIGCVCTDATRKESEACDIVPLVYFKMHFALSFGRPQSDNCVSCEQL